jgi:cholesterol transport system auxiliary component
MQPPQTEAPAIYVLDARPAERPARPQRDLVLVFSVPRARAGFDTAQMAFVRVPYELEYFAKSRWADTPSRMLAPLLVQALEQAGGFRAVVQAPSAVPADLRLDTELVRLQQNFATRPPQIELALRAQLVDVRSRRVLATAEFEEIEPATREDAYGGVIAANRALQRLLARLADFAAERSGGQ